MTLYVRYARRLEEDGSPVGKPFLLGVTDIAREACTVGHLGDYLELWVEAVQVPDPADVASRRPADVVHGGVCPTCGRSKEGSKG